MLITINPHPQQQSELRAVPKDGLNNGLKSRGLEWIPVDVPGSSQKKNLFIFNDLKRSVDVLGNPWIDGVERAKGIEPSS
ncbi:TPA: hypothetical protein ACIDZX_001669 [Pseudomonas aeruginosa]